MYPIIIKTDPGIHFFKKDQLMNQTLGHVRSLVRPIHFNRNNARLIVQLQPRGSLPSFRYVESPSIKSRLMLLIPGLEIECA